MKRFLKFDRLSLFSKIYLVVIALLVVANSLLAYHLATSEAKHQRQMIIERNTVLGDTAARGVEAGYHSGELPFELLSQVVQTGDGKFWLLIKPDVQVYASSDTSFWGKNVGEIFSGQIVNGNNRLFYDHARDL